MIRIVFGFALFGALTSVASGGPVESFGNWHVERVKTNHSVIIRGVSTGANICNLTLQCHRRTKVLTLMVQNCEGDGPAWQNRIVAVQGWRQSGRSFDFSFVNLKKAAAVAMWNKNNKPKMPFSGTVARFILFLNQSSRPIFLSIDKDAYRYDMKHFRTAFLRFDGICKS